MKLLILALAMVAGASQAHAGPAVPAFGCTLDATITETHSSVDLILVRGETVFGRGVTYCTDAFGQTTRQNVSVVIQSGGIGPAFNGPLQGLNIRAVRAGINNVDTMIGTYQLSAGLRLGLVKSRSGVMAGTQISGPGIGAGIEGVIENRFAVGLDLASATLAIKPISEPVKTRY